MNNRRSSSPSPSRGAHYQNINIQGGNNHLGHEFHTHYGPHTLDSNQLAEILRRRPQSIAKEPLLDRIPDYKPEAPEITYSSPLNCPKNEFPKVPEIAADDALVDKEPTDFVGRDLLSYLRRKVSDPLILLIEHCESGQLEKVQADLDEADKRYKIELSDYWAHSISDALRVAIMKNNMEMLRLLLERGADADKWKTRVATIDAGTMEETPLVLAIGLGRPELVRELISRKANVNKKSGPVDTPLKAAVLLGHFKITQLLVCTGATILDSDGWLNNSLMAAVSISDDSCDCLNLFLGELKFSTLRAGALRNVLIASVCWKKHKAYRSLLGKASAIAQCVLEPLSLAGLLECATHFNSLEVIRSIYASPEFGFSPEEYDKSLQIAASKGNFRAMEIFLQEDTPIRQALHSWQAAALELAVRCRDVTALKYMFVHGKNLNNSGDLSSALRYFLTLGSTNFVQYLVQQGADINSLGPNEAIKLAIQAGKPDLVGYLLDHGADPRLPDDGAALNLAVRRGYSQIIRFLAQEGAEIRFPEHEVALNLAIRLGFLEIAKFLVLNGTNNRSVDENTALRVVARQGSLEMVQFLVDEGFQIDGPTLTRAVISGNDKLVLYILSRHITVLNKENKAALLVAAAERRYGQTVVTLVERGPRSVSYYKEALEIAVKAGDLDIAKYFVSLGSPVIDDLVDMAAKAGAYDMTVFLIQQGAALRRPNEFLKAAVKQRDVKWTELLLEKGADINLSTSEGQALLIIAVTNCDKPTASLLLRKGADAKGRGSSEQAPLALAIEKCSSDMVELLIDYGADANGSLGSGESPLGRAVKLEKAEIVSILMKHGAKPNQPKPWSPLDIAILNGDENIVGILLTRISHLGGATGTEALKLALDQGKLGIVQQLVKAGADASKISNKSRFLSFAARRNDVPMLQFLRQAGYRFSLDDGAIALAKATDLGHCEMAKECLEAGADVNHSHMSIVNRLLMDITPLMRAAGMCNYRLVELYIKHGADVGCGADVTMGHDLPTGLRSRALKATLDATNRPPIRSLTFGSPVSRQDARKCIKFLVDAGADTNRLGQSDMKIVNEALGEMNLNEDPEFPKTRVGKKFDNHAGRFR